MKLLFPLLFLLLTLSCSLFNSKDESGGEKPLAKVYEKYLYPSDIEALGIDWTSGEDSIRFVAEFIENWIRQNLILEYAEKNLPADKLDLEKQVREYRESLIIYNYEREYMDQHLDTSISLQEINDFFLH